MVPVDACRRFARGALTGLACAPVALACSATDVTPVGPRMDFTLLPERAQVAVGDSIALTVRGDSPAAARAQIRWRSARPDVVRLDTTVSAGRPVVARAVATGEAVVNFTLSYQGSTVSGSALVSVR